MTDSIFFDLDGTMWDTTAAAAVIWRQVAAAHPEITDTVTADKLRGLYGLPLPELARRLFQNAPEEAAIAVMRECVTKQCPYLTEHGAILLGDVEGTLQKLSRRYPLFIISNCEDGYIQSFLEAHKLWQYFADFECPGRTGLLKADNIRLMMERHHLASPVYVGDTDGDRAAAEEAGVPFIFAAYGFGSAARYDAKIDAFEQLGEMFLGR